MKQLLRLGLVSRTFYYTPVWAAVELGFFSDEGLDAEPAFTGSEAQNQALVDGDLDIAIAPPKPGRDGELNAQQDQHVNLNPSHSRNICVSIQ